MRFYKNEIQNFLKPKIENRFSKYESEMEMQKLLKPKKTKTNFRESKSDVLKTKPEMEIQNFLKPKTDFQNSNPKSTYNIF